MNKEMVEFHAIRNGSNSEVTTFGCPSTVTTRSASSLFHCTICHVPSDTFVEKGVVVSDNKEFPVTNYMTGSLFDIIALTGRYFSHFKGFCVFKDGCRIEIG